MILGRYGDFLRFILMTAGIGAASGPGMFVFTGGPRGSNAGGRPEPATRPFS